MRCCVQSSLVLSAALLVLLALSPASTPVAAQRDDTLDWLPTGLTAATARLFTPSSGALLATTDSGALMRSDDAGATWREVPSTDRIAAVDPADQDTLYATSASSPLLKSADGGSSWTPLLTGSAYAGKTLDVVAASPADTRILYVGLRQGRISDAYWLLRTTDAGASWTQLFEAHNSLCGWVVDVLQAHPTDLNRMFFAGGCRAGRDFYQYLRQSRDQGQTLADEYTGTGIGPDATSGHPKRLVGGQGAIADRWYLAVNRDQRGGGSLVVRSDDDGATWNVILRHDGGGTLSDPDSWTIVIDGLAFDPSDPDHIFVAREALTSGSPRQRMVSGVTTSTDGGETWSDLGSQQLGEIRDLALGIDGRYLFAATDQGVLSMALR